MFAYILLLMVVCLIFGLCVFDLLSGLVFLLWNRCILPTFLITLVCSVDIPFCMIFLSSTFYLVKKWNNFGIIHVGRISDL